MHGGDYRWTDCVWGKDWGKGKGTRKMVKRDRTEVISKGL